MYTLSKMSEAFTRDFYLLNRRDVKGERQINFYTYAFRDIPVPKRRPYCKINASIESAVSVKSR